MTDLIFKTSPRVTFATNHFLNVPIILQYRDTPLLEVVEEQNAGYTTKFSVFHEDGTYLAKVIGSRVFATKDGEKVGVTLRHPDKGTVCEIGGKTILEIFRHEAAALKTQAELFCPDGHLLKSSDRGLTHLLLKGEDQPLQLGGLVMQGNTFQGCRIGIHVTDKGISIGCF